MPGRKIVPKGAVLNVVRPFQEFIHYGASGGILLLVSALVAMIWANSPWYESYHHLWHLPVSLGIGSWRIEHSLQHWINDGLMAIFFLLVGLEIKREMLIGELSSFKRAAMPIAAAIGGMIVPALIYTAFNAGTPAASGWGIPMATDIAFALGVLMLIPNVPLSLKVFLTALAIVDDLGAVLVIAVFYSSNLSFPHLAAAALILGLLVMFNRHGVQKPLAYIVPGFFLWYAFLQSGVHATISGVLLALTIPEASRIEAGQFLARGRALLDEYAASTQIPDDASSREVQQNVIISLEDACEDAITPLGRLEHGLHLWVSVLIIPLFALANAGITLADDFAGTLMAPLSLGVMLGLIVGKQVGITLFSWLAVRMGIAEMPAESSWMQIYAVGWLGGIGFTMSIFITGLAFTDPQNVDAAKMGIFAASIIAGVTGLVLLWPRSSRA